MSNLSKWNIFFPNCNPFSLNLRMAFPLLLISCSHSIQLNWKSCPPIPPRSGMVRQFGLAGPVSGASGNFIMVGGGANFENGMPWRGGTKLYHDRIFLLRKNADASLSWKESESKLPGPLAYPACITMKDGFISLGGENESGPVRSVFHYSFANGEVKIESLPDLPDDLSSPGATAIEDQLFVAGGLNKKGATNGFYTLSLSHLSQGWKKLPDLPVSLSHAVVVAQNDGHETAVYVIGGRNKKGELSTFLSTVYKFSPSKQKWFHAGEITSDGKPVPISAGTGAAIGNNRIVLFGGDRGFFFNQTERMNLAIAAEQDASRKDSLLRRKDHFLTNHPGFSNQILTFNTLSGKWSESGEIPGKSPATTSAFSWKGKIVIPSGEIRPGVRTDKVLMVEIKEN